MNIPLVSAIIPVYNGSNYLAKAIDSILNQTYTNIEILVIDDGSTDNTWEIIQSYGEKVHGYHKSNGGVSSALNYGIAKMNGDWFAWLSHDDFWHPQKIEKQIKLLLANPNVNMCYTGFNIIDENDNLLSEYPGIWYKKGIDLRTMLLHGSYIQGITVLINKSCFSVVGGFNEKLRCVQDGDMWYRILSIYDIGLVDEVLATKRLHSKEVGKLYAGKCISETQRFLRNKLKTTDITILFPELMETNTPSSSIKLHVMILLYKYYFYLYHSTLSQIIKKKVVASSSVNGMYKIRRILIKSIEIFK